MERFSDSKITLLVWAFVLVLVLTAGSANADFTFGEPVNLESIVPVLDGNDCIDCFSYDGLEMYVWAWRPGGQGGADLWVSRRATTDSDWGALENLGSAVNGPGNDLLSSISADGLTLYFCSDRPYGDDSRYDLFVTTRATKNGPWGQAVNLGPTINSPTTDAGPCISQDGLELYFESYRSAGQGQSDIYVTRRATASDPWGEPNNLGTVVNSVYSEHYLCLSSDGLLLLFSDIPFAPYRSRPGGYGASDMWMTERTSLSAPWQGPVNLGRQVNGSAHDILPRISPDGRTLYFGSERAGAWANWQSPVVPIVDFTGDGQVDEKDDLIMADCWDTNEPLCDIGPFAWGNGIIDAEDLSVLSQYMGKEVSDPSLWAHWALDEKEGTLAHDSAGQNDAFVIGEATWQPDGGMVDGALACDGVDDYLLARAIAGLSRGSFSILAWVRGGAPGQVVIGQQNGAAWLLANTNGTLMTRLGSSWYYSYGYSSALITDGAWHRIGLVWDSVNRNRILYVDGAEVARDYVEYMGVPDSNLILIGGGLGTGTFWSGLIDDVRIYKRIVIPLTSPARHISGPRDQ